MRWLHIYLSLLGLAALLFFSVTGITLNHPDWFLGESGRTVSASGTLPVSWLNLDLPAAPPAGEADDPSRRVAKLEVVEQLRKAHGVRGALAEFKADDRECTVGFKGPGYAADATIDRVTGRYTLSQTFHGVLALLNDLHKGRDTGPGWSILIDVSAILMTLISLTGLVLLLYLKRRRFSGLVTGVVGTVLVVAAYWLLVP